MPSHPYFDPRNGPKFGFSAIKSKTSAKMIKSIYKLVARMTAAIILPSIY